MTCGRGRGFGLEAGAGEAGVMSVMWSIPAANQCQSSSRKAVKHHHILSTRRASSDIRSGVQAGSHTRLTLTMPTPGTLATAFSTMVGNSPAAGALGGGQG